MAPFHFITIASLALAVSARPDGYTDSGVSPSPSPAPYRPRSPDESIFGSGSSTSGVGGGYFPAAAGSGGAGRVISLGSGGGGRRVQPSGPGSYSDGGNGGEGMPYDFGWAVQEPDTGNDFDHQETSDGVLTSGQYRVNLPDGRVQLVTYTVRGDSGYQAEVTYEGEAQYPPAPAPGQGYNGAASGGAASFGGAGSYNGAASGGAGRYSGPSAGGQSYNSAAGGQQRYASGSGNVFSGASAPSRSGRRYNSASSASLSSSAPSTQYGAAPSTSYGAASAPSFSAAVPSTSYGAGPVSSPRAPSTSYGAAPSRYNSALAGQGSGRSFGSRLGPLTTGGGYQGAGSSGGARLESSYGAPAAPSQSYGAV